MKARRFVDCECSHGAVSPWTAYRDAPRQSEAATEFAARISSMHQRL